MLDLKQDWSKLPSRTTMQREASIRELDRPPSPDVQPKWDIPELVVVGAAVSGRIVQEGQETRNFALDFDSFERAAVEAVQAGAAFIHIDTGGIAAIMESGLSVPQIYDKLTSAIGQKPAALTSTGSPTRTFCAARRSRKTSIRSRQGWLKPP